MAADVGILSAACQLPASRRSVRDIFSEEGVELTPQSAATLGIEQVPVCSGEKGSQLARIAAQEAIRRAGVAPSEIGVIVDYTVWPQEYLVPAWSMSNKLQHELGATKAFTVGFSGGGTTQFLISLHFAASLLRSDESVKTALLLAADAAIPGSRILNPPRPATIFGDGASAMVLERGAPRGKVIDSELWSDGTLHDVCYIPGGAMAHPDRVDLYWMRLDPAKYTGAPRFDVLRRLSATLLDRNGVRPEDIAYFLYPNLSDEDQDALVRTFGIRAGRICTANRSRYGHLQANDFVLNYLSMVDSGIREGEHVLLLSHGMGFTYGATLVQY